MDWSSYIRLGCISLACREYKVPSFPVNGSYSNSSLSGRSCGIVNKNLQTAFTCISRHYATNIIEVRRLDTSLGFFLLLYSSALVPHLRIDARPDTRPLENHARGTFTFSEHSDSSDRRGAIDVKSRGNNSPFVDVYFKHTLVNEND